MPSFRLPRLKANLAIVNGQGKPLDYFLRFWNIEVAPRIEQQEASQDKTIADLADIVAQLQAVSAAAQQAQTTANNAQQSADEGGTAKSGSSNAVVNIPATTAWNIGPIVNLTGVIAGDLTINGTGPQQTSEVSMSGGTSAQVFNFRVVEVISGVDDVIFSGQCLVQNFGSPAATTVTNNNVQEIQDFSMARASTGAVSYRIDFQGNGVRSVSNLLLYVFARRA